MKMAEKLVGKMFEILDELTKPSPSNQRNILP
jgi:hypothetical protein